MYENQSNSELEKILDLIAIAEETGVSESEYFMQELEKLSFRFDEIRFQKLMQKCISENLPSLLNRTFRNPVTSIEKEMLSGDYQIGNIAGTDIEVGLSRKALQLHSLISGSTGFGKTNSLNILANSIHKEGQIIQWFIDPKTSMGDFRWQAKRFPNTIVVPLSMLKLNPFAPIKNVPRKNLMERAIEVISDSFNVLDASQGVVTEHVEKIFQREEVPCFTDVANSILSEKTAKYGGRRQGYLDTLEVRIKTVKMSLGDVFDCRNDYFDQLYNSNIIFEVGGVSDLALKVLVPLIIMKLSLYKTYNASKHLSHLLYFEEAQGAIFSKILEMRARTPTVANLATQARSYGMGLVILAQNPVTKIITEMLSNSCTLLCLHVGGTEIRGMAECMGLTAEQAVMLSHVQPGEAIFKSSLGYTEPLHINVDYIDNTPPSDEEVKAIMQPKWDELLSHVTPVQKKVVALEMKKTEVQPTVVKSETVKSNFKMDVPEQQALIQTDDEILLKDIEIRPFQFSEDRYKQINLSRNRAIKAKERLCRLGYLDDVKFMTGRRGKPPSILRMSKKAYTYLGIEPQRGKGSINHTWWQLLTAYIAKECGLKAKLEDMYADVSISNGQTDIAVEITLSDSNIADNIKRNLNNGFAQTWLAVKDEAMLKCVQNNASISKEVQVFLLNEIILKINQFCSEK